MSLLLVVATVFYVNLFFRFVENETAFKNLTKYLYYACFFAVINHGQKLGEVYLEYIKGPEVLEATSPVIPEDYIDARVLMMKFAEFKSIVKNTVHYPFTFYGSRAYTMPQLYPARTGAELAGFQVIPLIVRDYGQEMTVTCESDCVLQTNIVPTSLHRVLINGREPAKVSLGKTENLDITLEAGSHVVRVDLVGTFVQPIIMSIWLALCLLGMAIVYALIMFWVEYRDGQKSAPV